MCLNICPVFCCKSNARISTCDDNEHNLALQHVAIFEEGDLALYDRNYASFWMFSLLMQKKTQFCARLKTGSWKAAKELAESGRKEMITEIFPSKASAKKCRELGLSTAPIKLRFICTDLILAKNKYLSPVWLMINNTHMKFSLIFTNFDGK